MSPNAVFHCTSLYRFIAKFYHHCINCVPYSYVNTCNNTPSITVCIRVQCIYFWILYPVCLSYCFIFYCIEAGLVFLHFMSHNVFQRQWSDTYHEGANKKAKLCLQAQFAFSFDLRSFIYVSWLNVLGYEGCSDGRKKN